MFAEPATRAMLEAAERSECYIARVMDRDELLRRISIDPRICFGKPCIRGHRIWVSLVLDWLASGQSIDDILAEYPQLERADLLACIAYGAEMSREHYVDLPLVPASGRTP